MLESDTSQPRKHSRRHKPFYKTLGRPLHLLCFGCGLLLTLGLSLFILFGPNAARNPRNASARSATR